MLRKFSTVANESGKSTLKPITESRNKTTRP
jgi:hypothetical protein